MRPALNLPMRFLLLFLSMILPTIAWARIGETSLQFVDRYGPPQDSQLTKIMDNNSPLIEGESTTPTNTKAGGFVRLFSSWTARACGDYQKILTAGVRPQIEDYELQAIASANTPEGMSWKKIMFHNPAAPDKVFNKAVEAYFAEALGQKMWERTDGAILWLRSNLVVRLELPIARRYEAQLKTAKEQKARDSVPQF